VCKERAGTFLQRMTLLLGYSWKAGQVRAHLRALADQQNSRLQDSVIQTRAEESKGPSRLSTPLLEAGHRALDPVRVAATERIQKFIQRVTLEPDDFNVERDRLPSQNINLGYVTRRLSFGPALGHQRQNAVCEQGNKLVALVEQGEAWVRMGPSESESRHLRRRVALDGVTHSHETSFKLQHASSRSSHSCPCYIRCGVR
jgi:hypothetical protein